jgi:hypothetical protein
MVGPKEHMPKWINQPLVVYHGSDTAALGLTAPILHAVFHAFSINLARCSPNTDFGRGFYTTTSDHQARQWANNRVRLAGSAGARTRGIVLSFAVSRYSLANLESLCFVRATSDYYALVEDCRLGFPPHQRTAGKPAYDVVYGPVSLGAQRLVIHDCDQIGFHTPAAVAVLPSPQVYGMGDPTTGLFP